MKKIINLIKDFRYFLKLRKLYDLRDLTPEEDSYISSIKINSLKTLKDKAIYELNKDLINWELDDRYAKWYKEWIIYFIYLIRKTYE